MSGKFKTFNTDELVIDVRGQAHTRYPTAVEYNSFIYRTKVSYMCVMKP
jgi:hypothetical protein